MTTAIQLLAHLIGDYVLQSGWMANNKTKRSGPAMAHALTYSLPFVLLCHPSLCAWSMIVITHFAIDRWRLARYVVYIKEFLAPRSEWRHWESCKATGLPSDTPPFLAVWLMIIVDNVMHISINALAISFL